jgi:hypothetical protein
MKTNRPISEPKHWLRQSANLVRALARHIDFTPGYLCTPLVLTDRRQQQRTARFLSRIRRTLMVVVSLAAVIGRAHANAATVNATLEPAEIALGEAAQLTVSVQGQDENVPQIPPVDGLSFQHVAQSSQIQIINGAMSASVSHTFAVIPGREGTFIIPAIKTGGDRDAAVSSPVVLKVLKRGSVASRPSTISPGNSPASIGTGNDEEDRGRDQSGFGFLRMISPKSEFYVGEKVPVELRAHFRSGVDLRVDGLPQLNSDAFVMNKLGDDPARSQQIIDGVPYTIFSWRTAITAVKAGEYPLSVQLPVTVTVRQPVTRPRSRGNDPFGDSFFDDAFFNSFFGATTQKQVALNSQSAATRILPLPTENRPAHFAGAVGKFNFNTEAAPAQMTAGDPVTLKLIISGTGNFDRVKSPDLGTDPGWKTYKPGTKFSPLDESGFNGEKTFEQVLVPMQPGKTEIPALAFSYFDPEQRQYVTRQSLPISIVVAAGQTDGVSAASAGSTAATLASGPAAPATVSEPSAGATRVLPRRSIVWQWLLDPWFAAGGLFSAAVFVGVQLFRHYRRRPDDSGDVLHAEARTAVAAQLGIMEGALARGASADFFGAARRALQIQLGVLWNLPPQAITQVEINLRSDSSTESVRPVFEAADEVAYTGRALTPGELWQWRDVVNCALRKVQIP